MMQAELAAVRVRLVMKSVYGLSCGPGWHRLLVQLDRRLAAIDPDYFLFQVKQKFGMLQYYAESTVDDDDRRHRFELAILAAVRTATHTCEECGVEGRMQVVRGWRAVLCDLHFAEFDAEGPLEDVPQSPEHGFHQS